MSRSSSSATQKMREDAMLRAARNNSDQPSYEQQQQPYQQQQFPDLQQAHSLQTSTPFGGGGGGGNSYLTSPSANSFASSAAVFEASPQTPNNNNNSAQPQQQQQSQRFASAPLASFATRSSSILDQPTPPTNEHTQYHSNNNNTTDKTSGKNDTLAAKARSEWRKHGSAKTQALEELRLPTTITPGNNNNNHGRRPNLAVRVADAEPRTDLVGAEYTAYKIQVWQPAMENTSTTVVYRRYSDFQKLKQALLNTSSGSGGSSSNCQAHDHHGALFPGKHWAGRVGNWTPASIWAPESHDTLIQTRVAALDVWLVHVVADYNNYNNNTNSGASGTSAAAAVHEFLTSRAPKLPCQQVNDGALSGRSSSDWYNNPVTFTLGSAIRQATRTVQYMTCKQDSIPLDLLQAAKGLLFLTVAKAGLVVTGRVGTGVLVAKLPTTTSNTSDNNNNNNEWSAPTALGTVGLGWGLVAGGDVTHYLVVLTKESAVENFCKSSGSINLGAEMGLAVGPVGRSASQAMQSADWAVSSAYSYAHSQGLFLGVSLEGSVVSVRKDVNAKFYGKQVKAADLLRHAGRNSVTAAEPLYAALDQALQMDIPKHAFRPSKLWNKTKSAHDGTGDQQTVVGDSQHQVVYRSEQWNEQRQYYPHPPDISTPQSYASTTAATMQQGNGVPQQHHHSQSLM